MNDDRFEAALDRFIEINRHQCEQFLATATPDMIAGYERELARLNREAEKAEGAANIGGAK